MMFYVYRHIRLDTKTPFYVGKGSNQRAYDLNNSRNRRHIFIRKIAGCRVEIILNNLSESDAFRKEKEFIKLYKKYGYCEANFTDGGEEVVGIPCSLKTKEKLRSIFLGKSLSLEHREKIRKSLKKVRPTAEVKDRISKTLTGRKLSLETKHKMSLSKSGISFSEEHRRNLSIAAKNRRRNES